MTPVIFQHFFRMFFLEVKAMKKGNKFKLIVFVFAAFTMVIYACICSTSNTSSRKTQNLSRSCEPISVPSSSSKLKPAFSCKSVGVQLPPLSSAPDVLQSEWKQVEAVKSLRFK